MSRLLCLHWLSIRSVGKLISHSGFQPFEPWSGQTRRRLLRSWPSTKQDRLKKQQSNLENSSKHVSRLQKVEFRIGFKNLKTTGAYTNVTRASRVASGLFGQRPTSQSCRCPQTHLQRRPSAAVSWLKTWQCLMKVYDESSRMTCHWKHILFRWLMSWPHVIWSDERSWPKSSWDGWPRTQRGLTTSGLLTRPIATSPAAPIRLTLSFGDH